MPDFRKKPVVVEARLLTRHGPVQQDIISWIRSCDKEPRIRSRGEAAIACSDGIFIFTLEGEMLARWGDWVVCGVHGEFYPCKPDIFKDNFTPINPDYVEQ